MTPTTSTPAPAQVGRRKPSALFSRSQLNQQRGRFEQVMAIIIWIAGYVGTMFAIAGGAAAFVVDPWRLLPWLGALLVQVVLTALQWWYGAAGWSHPTLLVTRAFDTALSTLGYAPLVAPALVTLISDRMPATPALVASWLIVAVVSLAAAWYPEHVFVD